MKLLFVTEFFPSDNSLQFTGGVESHNFYLFKELAKKHKVTVICRWGKDQKIQKNNWGMKIIRVGKKQQRIDTNFSTIPQRILFIFQSFKKGLSEDFDLVQGNNFVSYPSAFLLGLVKRKPAFIFYPDVFVGSWIYLVGLISGIIGEITERIYLVLPWSYIVSLSNSTTKKLLKMKVDPKKITTIYGGVDLEYFSRIKVKKKKIFTICCIARLVSYKRVDLLLKAAAILSKRKVNFRIEIIGQGPEDFSLKLLAQDLNILDKISFRPLVSREVLAKTLKSSHLFCLPSEQEGFGLVVMEAASCKIPYVVSDIDVFREITKNGKGGLLFKKGNAMDLANKINRIIRDRVFYKKLVTEAFNLAQQYNWRFIARQYEQTYKKILKKPIKILMLVDAWFPHVGGGQIHVLEIARGLAARGYQITILSRNLGRFNNPDSEIKVILLGKERPFANPLGRLEYLFLALIYSLTHNFDIYHAHAFSPGLIIPFIKFFKSGKTVFTVHGKGAKVAGLNINLNFLEELVVYKIPYDLEITVAKSTITKKVAAKKLQTIPNGVKLDTFKNATRVRRSVKNILFVGRLSKEKGVDLLIEAFKSLNQNLRVTIVGEGPEMINLKKLATPKIKFKGKLVGQKLISEYKRADLLVLPSRSEGHPLTLFEGWASKLPVLATDVGDNRHYIKNGINGYLAQPNKDSIKESTLEAINSKKLSKVGAKGFESVQKYDWDKISDQTEKAYQGFLK